MQTSSPGGLNVRRWALPTALVVAAGSLWVSTLRPSQAAAAVATKPSSPTILTVRGTASSMVTPATASIRLGTTVHARTARAAMNQSSQTMSRVVRKVEEDGIAAKDLQTGQINLFPENPPGHPDEIAGYRVTQTLRITVNAIGKVGQVIDDAVAAGANQMDGVSFLPPDPRQWEQSAYHRAIEDAATKAKALAADAHERILGIASIDTTNSPGGNPLPVYSKAIAAPNVPVLPGQTTERVTVTVRYRLGSG